MATEKKVYFANETDSMKLAGSILERKSTYQKFLHESGLFQLYRRMHRAYYGHDEKGFTAHRVHADGQEGEISRLRLNHLRSIVTSWLNLASAQRPTMDPIAPDGDYESVLQQKRARALLDHYQFKRKFEESEKEALELAAVLGAGWEFRRWNANLGEVSLPTDLGELGLAVGKGEMTPDAAQATENQVRAEAPKRPGELESFALGPMDVFFDPYRKNARFPWLIVRLHESRHDLLSRHPQFEKQLLEIGPEREELVTDLNLFSSQASERKTTDEIPVYYLLHEPSEAVRDGKFACVLSDKTVLDHGPLKRFGARDVTARRVATADLRHTPFAYTPAFDLLAPQEACDALTSITLTNQKTFGLGAILTPKGQDIDPQQIAEGLVLVEYTQGLDKPSALEMPATPQDVYVARKQWVDEMGTILGVNQVIRGNPEASLKSGSALALVQAMGVQFSSGFQANIVVWREEKALDIVQLAVDNMSDERQFEVLGENTSSLIRFAGDGVSKVVKVRCAQVNPLAKTLSGRVEMADKVIERFPNDLRPVDYFKMIETGTADHLGRGQAQAQALIDRENELLAQGIGPIPLEPMYGPDGMPIINPDGKPKMVPMPQPGQRYVICLMTDDHRAHVRGHLEVLSNPAVRQGDSPEAQAVIKAVLDHVDEHEGQLAQMTVARPGLLELTGQLPLQAALPPPMLGPGPGGEAPGEPKGSAPPEKEAQQPTPPGPGRTAKMPSMPVNPANGQRVESPQQPAAPH